LTDPLAVYVHWPYCARICPYCDFNVVRDRGQAEQADLARAIVADLERTAIRLGGRRLTSVFFGGGTPSLMRPEWVADILMTAKRLWPSDGRVEVSLEANPTDAEAGRFAAFAEAGVQRLSLGVQSFDEEALSFLGRNHSGAEALRAVETAVAAFPRVSIDLIYARPGQTAASWETELRRAAGLGVEHISPYQLTIEAGTAFDRAVRRRTFTPADPDLAADLYEITQDVLTDAGFDAYEVSNHARGEAARSVHNLAYWRGWDYAGVGPGAHGRLTIDGARLATEAARKVADYIAADGWAEEVLYPREAAIERLLLGLRSVEGVPMADIAALEIDPGQIHGLGGFVTLEDGRLTATPAGRTVLDRVTEALIP
jgi:putative oxygen-independent coproporphyrinogen III oxidase